MKKKTGPKRKKRSELYERVNITLHPTLYKQILDYKQANKIPLSTAISVLTSLGLHERNPQGKDLL